MRSNYKNNHSQLLKTLQDPVSLSATKDSELSRKMLRHAAWPEQTNSIVGQHIDPVTIITITTTTATERLSDDESGGTNTPGSTLVQSDDTAPPSTYVCRTKGELQFPKLENLRLRHDNVKVGDIIHCKSSGDTILCHVTKVNATGIKVDDLEIQWVNNHTEFHKVIKELPHKGTLGYSRRMFIIDRDELTLG